MIYDKLSKLVLFQSISQKGIGCLNKLPYSEKNYQAGEKVALFGDSLDQIFVIMKGTLKTNEYTVEGKEIVSSYYQAYDAFPFYLIYSGVSHFPYNVICHKDAQVILLPAKELFS